MMYEYCALNRFNRSDDEWIEQLNALGQYGWELVSIIGETEQNHEIAYFKKIKS